MRLGVSQHPHRLLPRDICPILDLAIKGLVKKENISLAPLQQIRALRGAHLEDNARVLGTATATRIDDIPHTWN